MSYQAKVYRILDLTTLSSSGGPRSDFFRTSIGGIWNYFSESEGSGYSFQIAGTEDGSYNNKFIKNIYTNRYLIKTSSATSLQPNYVVPVRIVGNSKDSGFEDFFPDSIHWQYFLNGGTIGTSSYKGIFDLDVFDSHQMLINVPYDKQHANILHEATVDVGDTIEISYDYNHSYRKYEEHISNLPELLIPNIYQISSFYNTGVNPVEVADIEAGTFIDESIKNFVSIEGTIDATGLTDLLDSSYRPWEMPPRSSAKTIDRTMFNVGWTDSNLNLRSYLTGALLQNQLSASTIAAILTSNQNLYFDSGFFQELAAKVEDRKEKFPFYAKISIPNASNVGGDPEDDSNFKLRYIIENEDYSSKFLKMLHESFGQPSAPSYLGLERPNYSVSYQYYTASIDKNLTYIEETADAAFLSKELFDLLVTAYNFPDAQLTNCSFAGKSTTTRKAALDIQKTYTIMNTIRTLNVLDQYVQDLTSSIGNTEGDWGTYHDLVNFAGVGTDYDASSYTTTTSGTPLFYNPAETVAYRIQKKDRTGAHLQTFWIYNNSEFEKNEGSDGSTILSRNNLELNFYDSQVKYGVEYQYEVYAYIVNAGIKYNYSDFKIAHVIASSSIDTTPVYCLKFTDALSGYDGEGSDQLYYLPEESSIIYTPEAYELFESTGADPHSLNLALTGSGAHLISTEPFVADFNLKYQVTPKIFEVLIASKNITILDNPVAELDVNPFQLLDNSQKIGFSLRKDMSAATSTEYAPYYPTSISSADKELKTKYLQSNNLIETISRISMPAVSEMTSIEVYRTTNKPSSIGDFDGELLATIDLRIFGEDEEVYLSTYDFYDTISTNKKYYYLFRGLDIHQQPGFLSKIYESELVNDGGYKYAVFNVLFENELVTNPLSETSITARKLIKIQPAPRQLAINASESDFEETATSQLENIVVGPGSVESVWDKTFKFRLTSKKTSKKIDLNITYKLETEE